MTFLVVVHKDPESSYGVSVPDLPGCISAGDTFADALNVSAKAIKLHLMGMLDDDIELPEPTTDIEHLRQDPNDADAIWAVVNVHVDWKRTSTAAA